MNELNADGIVRFIENMRWCCGDRYDGTNDDGECSEHCINPFDCREGEEPRFCRQWLIKDAANLIESLQAQLAASQRRAQDARNELCLRCGRYKEAHKGSCDGCRWKEG